MSPWLGFGVSVAFGAVLAGGGTAIDGVNVEVPGASLPSRKISPAAAFLPLPRLLMKTKTPTTNSTTARMSRAARDCHHGGAGRRGGGGGGDAKVGSGGGGGV